MAWISPHARQQPVSARLSDPAASTQPSNGLPMRRQVLQGLGGALVGVSSSVFGSAAEAKDTDTEISIYFGTGNFWHLQHEFVYKEGSSSLSRRQSDITSVNGFAGGTKVGDLDRLCYSNFLNSPQYSKLMHGEVTQLLLPKDSLTEFATLFFQEVSQRKNIERSSEFRPQIGLRKGLKSELWPLIAAANVNGTKIEKGEGDETGSTAPDSPEIVYVYDSRFFPFRPAETYNQFKQDPIDKSFDADYKTLNPILKGIGTIASNGCP